MLQLPPAVNLTQWPTDLLATFLKQEGFVDLSMEVKRLNITGARLSDMNEQDIRSLFGACGETSQRSLITSLRVASTSSGGSMFPDDEFDLPPIPPPALTREELRGGSTGSSVSSYEEPLGDRSDDSSGVFSAHTATSTPPSQRQISQADIATAYGDTLTSQFGNAAPYQQNGHTNVLPLPALPNKKPPQPPKSRPAPRPTALQQPGMVRAGTQPPQDETLRVRAAPEVCPPVQNRINKMQGLNEAKMIAGLRRSIDLNKETSPREQKQEIPQTEFASAPRLQQPQAVPKPSVPAKPRALSAFFRRSSAKSEEQPDLPKEALQPIENRPLSQSTPQPAAPLPVFVSERIGHPSPISSHSVVHSVSGHSTPPSINSSDSANADLPVAPPPLHCFKPSKGPAPKPQPSYGVSSAAENFSETHSAADSVFQEVEDDELYGEVAITEDLYGDVQDSLSSQPWFHGPLTRAFSDAILQRTRLNGAFLVRESSEAGAYTLCIWQDRVWNLQIRRRNTGNFALGSQKHGEKQFPTVEELVQHHREVPITFEGAGSSTVLCKPIPHSFARSQHSSLQ